MVFVAVLFVANFAVGTFGHPYVPFGQPYSSYSSVMSPQTAYGKYPYGSYSQASAPLIRQFPQLTSPSSSQISQLSSFPGVQPFKQPAQPQLYRPYQSRSSCPNCQRQEEEFEDEQSPEISIPSRTVRSVAKTSIPVAENVQLVAPPSADMFENNDSSFMRAVRSALLALEPLFAVGEPQVPFGKAAQREIPVSNSDEVLPTSDTRTQQTQSSGNSPQGCGCGMYYNVRVQSISAISDRINQEVNKKTETELEAKEQKVEERQNEILNALDELSQGQMATLMQQFGIEMMAEREFKIQEQYLKEIKRILNLIKTAGESRNKVASMEMGSNSVPNKETQVADLESETTTSNNDQPDTTSAIPTSEVITSTESARIH